MELKLVLSNALKKNHQYSSNIHPDGARLMRLRLVTVCPEHEQTFQCKNHLSTNRNFEGSHSVSGAIVIVK